MRLARLALLAAATATFSTGAPSRAMTADPTQLDIANVKLGMDADQAMAALRQTFGRNIMDLRVYDQSVLDVVKINKDMNYPRNKIFYSVYLPGKNDKDGYYTNHIFYNIQDVYVGKMSIIVDLAKPPGQEDGPARVYQVLQVTRGGIRGPVFDEVSARVAEKYGSPTAENFWCAQPENGSCAADKPYLALYLIRDPAQSIKSVLQLFDPGYGTIGPEAVGSAGGAGSLSFERHTSGDKPDLP